MVEPDLPVPLRGVNDEPLTYVVQRQRQENDGLRAALRYRAVIEQAKGILMARTGVGPETAFQQLVGHSQRTHLKVTRVAAAVVARTITSRPAVPSPAPADAQILEDATSDHASQRLAASAVAAAPDFTELIQAVVQHTAEFGVVAGTLALAEPDGALRLVAWHGIETHIVSGWQRIPPSTDLPMCAAAAARAPLWLRDRDERLRRFPGSAHFPGHREAGAALPLVLDRQLIGCLSLDWDEPVQFDEATREHLAGVAELCASPVAMLLRRHDDALPDLHLEPGYAHWFRAFLDSTPAPTLILEPELEGGELVEFRILFINRAATRQPELAVGRGLLESHPELASGRFLDDASAVLRSGMPVRTAELTLSPDGARLVVEDVNLVRIGSLLTLNWRPTD